MLIHTKVRGINYIVEYVASSFKVLKLEPASLPTQVNERSDEKPPPVKESDLKDGLLILN